MTCEGGCVPCGGKVTKRVWFAGCDPGCGGHLVCSLHGNGRTHQVVRVDMVSSDGT